MPPALIQKREAPPGQKLQKKVIDR
jgi:hypothetical protein